MSGGIRLGTVTPVLRIFDEAKAVEFYCGLLGFKEIFRHRFGDNFPLYMGIERDDCRLHLSAHHGDCTPGAYVRIAAKGVAALARELAAKDYRYAKPGGPEATPWGTRELSVTDPFGNRLVFAEEAET